MVDTGGYRYNAVHCIMIFIHLYSDWCRTWIRVWNRKSTPYLALTGELWGVFCENFGENWSRYNVTALYNQFPGWMNWYQKSDSKICLQSIFPSLLSQKSVWQHCVVDTVPVYTHCLSTPPGRSQVPYVDPKYTSIICCLLCVVTIVINDTLTRCNETYCRSIYRFLRICWCV